MCAMKNAHSCMTKTVHEITYKQLNANSHDDHVKHKTHVGSWIVMHCMIYIFLRTHQLLCYHNAYE